MSNEAYNALTIGGLLLAAPFAFMGWVWSWPDGMRRFTCRYIATGVTGVVTSMGVVMEFDRHRWGWALMAVLATSMFLRSAGRWWHATETARKWSRILGKEDNR